MSYSLRSVQLYLFDAHLNFGTSALSIQLKLASNLEYYFSNLVYHAEFDLDENEMKAAANAKIE